MATITVDNFIYGATLPGIINAKILKDLGQSVAIAEWTKEIAGAPGAGLCLIDHVGDTVCGRAKLFWQAVETAAIADGATEADYERNDVNGLMRKALPSWVLTVANSWLSGVTVLRDIELLSIVKDPVTKRVTSSTLSNGNTYVFKSWADWSYEGDLLAMAGVPLEYGRTGRSQYGEINAGVTRHSIEEAKRGTYPVRTATGDLYRYRTHEPSLPDYAGDISTQPFNWRMLYSSKADRIPFTALEAPLTAACAALGTRFRRSLYADFIDEGVRRPFNGISFIASQQAVKGTSADGICTTNGLDYVGHARKYPRLRTKAARQRFLDEHFVYTAGRYFIAATETSFNTPMQNDMAKWGLPASEWTTRYWRTPGWPPAPYVRSCFRSRAQRVVTFNNRNDVISDPIAVANYGIDSHSHYWYPDVVAGGWAQEGEPDPRIPGDYRIPERCIIPDTRHVTNGIAGWCAGESYIMSLSMRIESTKMVMAEAAAYRMFLANASNINVSAVSYGAVREMLDAAAIKL